MHQDVHLPPKVQVAILRPSVTVLRVCTIQVKNNGFFHEQKVGARGGFGGERVRGGDSHWTLIVPILGGGLT